MADPMELPEPDRIEGAPHPRETRALVGQAAAEQGFLTAYNGGRLHHAWLISGPRGVGKATLAWRIARFLLATPADDGGMFGAPPPPDRLDIDPEHPVVRRSMQMAEPGLFVLRRGPNDKGDKLSADIRVNEVRKLREFFGLSASDGGRRVVIVDAADEMNTQAANALLKMLEEPPRGATLLLVTHQPSRLLPTIRSRCRELRLSPLAPPDLARAMEAAGELPGPDAEPLGELAGGSVGEAMRLSQLDGLKIYQDLVSIFAHAPRYDRPRAIALAQSAAGAANATRYALILDLIDQFLARLARSGAGHPPLIEAAPGEAALFARLAPDAWRARRWAEKAQDVSSRAAHGRAVNLDPAALILDTTFRINETAAAYAA
ncbi:DNA polymerase-3 subunit delta' [Maritimibacter alkaliphilus HTCC2654]|uniref:DNA polymerase III subunit delta n=1 Tax=Maritimibacter alkaliphilus HTCC2654 TaxID=314271 RepID=A3VAZ1_9RHOB|nr:DNA polymerase III subunit delta' [Maritimibacter alkaliphilus]EAQ15082.1 DNA polymerase III subunit delta [Maritimibacter alkaliphilus HTCC2654]TYP78688.1 DNA polymerase-3 subunit delta' [Maritimibacter alkaliphilus HTCC2654]